MPNLGKKVFSEDEEDTEENKVFKKRKKNKEQYPDITGDEEKKIIKKKVVKKTTKKKAPLDVDRQCGVIIQPNNMPCTRSLTCKIHSMGAKRSVEGRSQPFNDLLANYQKKGVGRPQDQQKDDILVTQQSQELYQENPILIQEVEIVDSDEETENVRTAIEQNKPFPLCQKQVFYVQRKRKYYKLRDILLEAITPKTV